MFLQTGKPLQGKFAGMRIMLALFLFAHAATLSAGSARDSMAAAKGDFADGVRAPKLFRHTADLRYGPFIVLDDETVMLNGETDSRSPSDFQRMIFAFPRLRVLKMMNCPGTRDDVANLRLGRMIHAQGMATSVPASGSVRSGAVELFIAGVRRTVSSTAEFAVHSWIDEKGREAQVFAENDPVNRTYIAYYRDMGLSDEQANAFYALTNSVRNNRALWIGSDEIARYVALRKISDV